MVNASGNNTRPLTCVQFRIHRLLVCRVSAWPIPCPVFGQTDPLIEVLQFAFSLFQSCLFQVIPPIGQDYLVCFQSAQGLSLELITICRCIKCTSYFIIHDTNKPPQNSTRLGMQKEIQNNISLPTCTCWCCKLTSVTELENIMETQDNVKLI